jgi:hypothetical protein
MKKLLALILCVMMFVSIVPTAAFAANYDSTDQRVWKGANQDQKIVEALRTNIQNMYGSYAVDNAVYNSVKTIDGILKDLVDGALKDYTTSAFNGAAGLTSSSDLNDAIVAGLRSTIGGQISEYLNKHYNEYYTYDSMGHRVFDPTKYAGVYAKAASDALTSSKATAGIQAYMLYAYQRSAYNTVANMAHDLRNDIDGWDHWADYGFSDMSRNIHTWNTPDATLDGILHNIDPNYVSVLSALGQLGVNLDGSTQDVVVGVDARGRNIVAHVPTFGLGFDGWISTVDGNHALSNATDDETVTTALITNFYADATGTQIPNATLPGLYVTTYEETNGVFDSTGANQDDYNVAWITSVVTNPDGSVDAATVAPVNINDYSNDQWGTVAH